MSLLVEITIRSSAVLLVGLLAVTLLRHRSAALRHAVLACALVAAGAMAPLSLQLPAWEVAAPAVVTDRVAVAAVAVLPSAAPRLDDGVRGGGSVAVRSVLAVWAIGVVTSLGVLLLALFRLARITARARPVTDRRWLRRAAELSANAGMASPVALLHTATPDVLATWGVRRPCVLLPAQAEAWRDDRVHAVLAHEIAHVQRRDWMIQLGAELLRAVYWFNPLVWLACARLRRESEQACDDAVLAQGIGAGEYARHLIEVVRTCRRSGLRVAPAMPMARPSMLEGRIAAMLNPRIDRTALSRRALALTCVLMLGVLVPLATLRATQTEPMPLSGTVYDATGGVLPGVEVTLEGDQQARWQTRTDSLGRFEFPPVQPGRYGLEVALAGFRALRQEIELQHTADWDRAITLQVGELTETVWVQATRLESPPAAPDVTPRRVRVGGNVKVPTKIRHVNPVYPDSMRQAGREGRVAIDAIIGADGSVQAARVVSAHVHPDFAVAAIDAVRQWEFTPTILNGTPVEVRMTVHIDFSLAD